MQKRNEGVRGVRWDGRPTGTGRREAQLSSIAQHYALPNVTAHLRDDIGLGGDGSRCRMLRAHLVGAGGCVVGGARMVHAQRNRP